MTSRLRSLSGLQLAAALLTARDHAQKAGDALDEHIVEVVRRTNEDPNIKSPEEHGKELFALAGDITLPDSLRQKLGDAAEVLSRTVPAPGIDHEAELQQMIYPGMDVELARRTAAEYAERHGLNVVYVEAKPAPVVGPDEGPRDACAITAPAEYTGPNFRDTSTDALINFLDNGGLTPAQKRALIELRGRVDGLRDTISVLEVELNAAEAPASKGEDTALVRELYTDLQDNSPPWWAYVLMVFIAVVSSVITNMFLDHKG